MTRQQRWAGRAFELVSSVRNEPFKGKYDTLCKKAPLLIRQCGVAQALASLRSKREGAAGERFVNDLAAVYTAGGGSGAKTGSELQRRAHSADNLGEYLALSRELAEISVWMRRFAQSELGELAEPEKEEA